MITPPIKLAIAVNQHNKVQPRHFGDANEYRLYSWNGKQFTPLQTLKNRHRDMEESEEHGSPEKGNNIASMLRKEGVSVLVSKQFGKNITIIRKHFVPILSDSSEPDKALETIAENIDAIQRAIEEGNTSGQYGICRI